jgi:GYF domain 2
MADRSWFFASQGQQQGPYPEGQLREFVASGAVTAETLVWTEGMANWQRAGDIPGLFSGAASPPAIPRSGMPLTTGGSAAGQSLSTDFGIWALLGRLLLLIIGTLFVIPAPWVATGWYRWFAERLHVPQRPNLAFTGKPGDIWYVFVILGLGGYVGLSHVPYLQYVFFPVQGFLGWMIVRWFTANLSSDGRPLSLSFTGSPWVYIGWHLLGFLSFITIIGWAWVLTAWVRWICRHIDGTRREIVFEARGLQVLWRTLVFILATCFIIPIPWVLGWYVRWNVSQFTLVRRAA